MPVIEIVSSAMTAAVYIPMAKLLDVWGRAEGFLLMVGSATLGIVLMATSNNLETYCAAQVGLTQKSWNTRRKCNGLRQIGFLLHWVCRHHLHRRCSGG
jgi:hypothetical protein